MSAGARLHDRLLGEPTVAARFSDHTQLQMMLDVEAALADAEATSGVIPASCVAPIQSAAKAELYDCTVIAADAVDAGNVVIPVVRHLTARVAAIDADAARYVHWGATSQDVLDTGLVLQLRAAVPAILDHLERAQRAAAGLARRYADATMPGRTWLQQATPITFGLKAAGWTDALDRIRRRVATALDDALVLQFGGASGTLAALGSPVVPSCISARSSVGLNFRIRWFNRSTTQTFPSQSTSPEWSQPPATRTPSISISPPDRMRFPSRSNTRIVCRPRLNT